MMIDPKWTIGLGLVVFVLIGIHWIQSSAPKPVYIPRTEDIGGLGPVSYDRSVNPGWYEVLPNRYNKVG